MTNDDILSIPRFASAMKREYKLILLSLIIFLALAVLFIFLATEKFTAKTSILLDPTLAASNAEISSKVEKGFEVASILSQVELIKSRSVTLKALQFLNAPSQNSLSSDQEFSQSDIDKMQKNVRVFREGESYVLNIHYTANDPEVAADNANAYAKAYIDSQANSFTEDSRKAGQWLQEKIEEARLQTVVANKKLSDFKGNNNLLRSDRSSVNEQQLSRINDKLGDAKAESASARVKYFHSKNIIDKRNISAAVAEAFDNDVINKVRTEYLDDQQKLMKLQRTLGDNHQLVISLKKQLNESRNIIFLEMKRLAESHKNEYEIALAKEQSLEASLDGLVNKEISNGKKSFELEALEKEFETYSDLYEEYLKKFENIQHQQNYPVDEVKIISSAVPPHSKSHPNSLLILAVATILGLGLGVLLALVKDSLDNNFKRAGQIENIAGLKFLGFFPLFANIKTAMRSGMFNRYYSASVLSNKSIFAETCRTIKTRMDKHKRDGECQIIGVVSENPNDEKSTVSSNLALFVANSKSKCLLIDADSFAPHISRDNFDSVKTGLASVLSNNATIEDAILRDDETGLYFLPCETSSADKENLVSSMAMRDMIKKLKAEFDYIIVDLPPLSTASDASYSSVFLDYYLLVLEWGKSNPNNLEFTLKVNDIAKDKIIGTVLNNANMDKMRANYGHKTFSEYTEV